MLTYLLQRLPTTSRPSEVATWLKGGRRPDAALMPALEDYHSFGKLWNKWWIGMQPSWRENATSHDVPPGANWSPLLNGGPNGILIAILALAWWNRRVVDDDSERASIQSAIDEVSWVLVQMRTSLGSTKVNGKKRQLEEDSTLESPAKK
jgi:hypothetical protein